MNWVFIQHQFSGSVHSCDTAHGQKRAFGSDAVTQLCELVTKNWLGWINSIKRQGLLLAATEQVNRTDARYASAAHFQR
jgi:hypothetical protein